MRVLRGDGVSLEPQVAGHAAEMFAVLRDPALYVFTDDKEPVSEEWLRARFARLESRRSPDGRQHWLNWVVRNDAGEAVGYVQATVEGNVAEIAYVIGLAHQGRGYARAACRAMLAELAEAYRVRRVTATLDPENTASLALLGRLGFGLEREDVAAHEAHYIRGLVS